MSRLIDLLPRAPFLVGGVGNDAAALDIGLPDGKLLLVNSDRTGVNLAFQLELSSPVCIGDLAVSHAVSDIYACGGLPNAITTVLLLPADTSCEFAETSSEVQLRPQPATEPLSSVETQAQLHSYDRGHSDGLSST